MFQRILVPFDLSGAHDALIRLALDLARRDQAELVLLHVIETISGVGLDEEAEFYGELEKNALARLESLGATHDLAGIRCEAVVRYGEPAREVVRYAAEVRADLIVVPSERATPDGPFETLSHRLGLMSPCPVLLVR